MGAKQLMKNRGHKFEKILKENKEGYMEECGEGKGKGEECDYTVISKIKRIVLKFLD